MEAVKRYLDRDGLELYDSLLKDMIGEIAGRNIVSIDDNPDGSITITYTDGTTWTSEPLAGRVTGVKGNAESTYREGDVNITLDDIGLTANDITDALGYIPVGTDFHVAQTATTGNFDRRVLLSATDTDTTETSTTFKNGDFTYNASTGVLTVPHIAGNPGEVISALEPSAEDQVTGDYWIKVISTQQDGTKIVQKYQKQGDGTYAPITEAVSASAVTLRSGNTVQDFIGTTSISDVGDGSITGAISTLNTAVNNIDVSTKLDKANSSPLSGNKVVVTDASGNAIASSVTATDLEGFSTGISNAATAASNAATAAAAAQSTADGAATTASSAYTRSGTAISTANGAASDASSALSQVGDRLATSAGGTTLGANKVVITDEYGKAKASTVTASDLANMSSNISTALDNASTAVSTANTASSTASSALTEAGKKLETLNDTKTLTGNMVVITSPGGYATTGNVSSSELNMLDGISTTAGSIESRLSTAASNASTALSTANTASSTASTASTNASTALSNSNARLATSNGSTTLTANKLVITDSYGKAKSSSYSESDLSTISSDASTAKTNAATALSTANTASSNANARLATTNGSTTLTANRIVETDSSGKAKASDYSTQTLANLNSDMTTAKSNISSLQTDVGNRLATASGTTLSKGYFVVTNSSTGKAEASSWKPSNLATFDSNISTNTSNIQTIQAQLDAAEITSMGETIGHRRSNTYTLPNNSVKAVTSMTIPAGTWLIVGHIVLTEALPTTAQLQCGLHQNTNASGLQTRAAGADKISVCDIITFTSATTINLLAHQNSGSSVTVNGDSSSIDNSTRIVATKLGKGFSSIDWR